MSKKDPYLDFLNTDSLLFGTSVGKDPLKFSDPLSFGTSDPLSFGGSDKKQEKKEDKDDFDQDSRHSGDDDFATAPPMDYLGYIQVMLNSLRFTEPRTFLWNAKISRKTLYDVQQ